MSKSKIEWTEAVWNPVTGCTKVSAGCKNCYAERMTARLQAMETEKYAAGFGQVVCHPEDLEIPLKRKKPTTYFVNSMSDLFHKDVDFEFIDMVFDVMEICKQHIFQILTKRPERMQKFFDEYCERDREPGLPNVWLGVSVEDQATAEKRIPVLLECPAVVRFVSYEPALGPVDLDQWFIKLDNNFIQKEDCWGIHWVICGGESGPGARPMHPDWARSVRDQCQAAGVPFFFKQWGEWGNLENLHDDFVIESENWTPGHKFYRANGTDIWCFKIGKKRAGRLLDGREWNGMPEKVVV